MINIPSAHAETLESEAAGPNKLVAFTFNIDTNIPRIEGPKSRAFET